MTHIAEEPAKELPQDISWKPLSFIFAGFGLPIGLIIARAIGYSTAAEKLLLICIMCSMLSLFGWLAGREAVRVINGIKVQKKAKVIWAWVAGIVGFFVSCFLLTVINPGHPSQHSVLTQGPELMEAPNYPTLLVTPPSQTTQEPPSQQDNPEVKTMSDAPDKEPLLPLPMAPDKTDEPSPSQPETSPPVASTHIDSGNSNLTKGHYGLAIKDFSTAITLDPYNASIYAYRAYAYYKKGQYDHAIADFTKAIKLNPHDAVIYNSRGNAYSAMGNVEKAIPDFEKACESGWADACEALNSILKKR